MRAKTSRLLSMGLLWLAGLAGLPSLGAETPKARPADCTATAGPTRALGLYKPAPPVPLEDGFRDPPAISRAQCWWQCHGSAFTKEEITRELEQFRAKGMGGVTVKDTLVQPRDERTRHIADIPYMSDRWLDMFAHVVGECGRLGLICRCRLGSGWNAGGPWVTPEMSSQVIACEASGPIVGPARFSGPIPRSKDKRPSREDFQGKEAFVVAVCAGGERRIDLSGDVAEDLTLACDVPKGTWTIYSCFSRPSGRKVMSCSPSGSGLHHDHLSTAGTDLQLAHVAEPILARLGPLTATAFDGFNCDSWELGNPTWTPGFRQAFLKRRGYDPVPYLPVLAKITDGGIGRSVKAEGLTGPERRFLVDFRNTVSDLVIETHYARISRWCREHGVAFEAEAGGPSVVPRAMLRAQGAVDIPMGEFWMSPRSEVKTASSAAHVYGRRLVALESFTDTRSDRHFSISPTEMKLRADEAFLLGGNYLTLAVTEYSPQDAGLPGWAHNAGPHLNHCQTWWPLARPFFDYLARCCFLLQSGRNVAHVAEYRSFRTPKTALWREQDDRLSSWPKTFAFDYVGDDAVQNRMEVRDGQLALSSGGSYQVLYVVATGEDQVPLETLVKIRDLLEGGATVVWAGPRPAQDPGLADADARDARVRQVAEQLWANPRLVKLPRDDRFRLIPIVEAGRCPPAWKMDNRQPLRFAHRRTREADVFFVVNRAPRAVREPITFRIRDRQPQFWVPESGEIHPAPHEAVADGTRIVFRMTPGESLFVVFARSKEQSPGGAKPAPRQEKPSPRKIAVGGPWQVEFPEGSGAPRQAVFETLVSWPERDEAGIRHFSGIATYRAEFPCPALSGPDVPVELDLGRVCEVCRVSLNGQVLGTAWHAPYRFDATGKLRTGTNRLEVQVANLWHNRLVGDAPLPASQRVSRVVPQEHYRRVRGKPLLDSGLLGPVELILGHAGR